MASAYLGQAFVVATLHQALAVVRGGREHVRPVPARLHARGLDGVPPDARVRDFSLV